jgi:hypothetical protein
MCPSERTDLPFKKHNMKSITKPGDNLGGLIKMWAVPASVVSLAGRTVNFSATTDIYEIYCTPGSMSHAEPPELTAAGTHYNVELSGFIPRDSDTVRTALEDMERKPYAVLFQDGNGEFKLAGSTAEPLRCSSALNTGKDVTELAGNEIRFTGRTTRRAVFVDNPFD